MRARITLADRRNTRGGRGTPAPEAAAVPLAADESDDGLDGF